MSIIRRKKNRNYSTISNECLQDPSLSWKAKGLFAYMMSLPDDWKLYKTELLKHATDGKDSTRSGFDELVDRGYVIPQELRDENGRMAGWDYIVTETPTAEKPIAGNPPSVNPTSDTPPLQSTKHIQSTNKQNTNLTSRDSADLGDAAAIGVEREPPPPTPAPAKSLEGVIKEFNLSPQRREALNTWLAFKKEKKQGYKPIGLRSLLKQWDGKSDAEFVSAVESSTAANYSGLFAQKSTKSSAKSFDATI